jgi:beta-RFAP synthase
MIRVHAPSRLHFGLFNLGTTVVPARRFGSVGLMIQEPGLRLTLAPAVDWSAEGPLAERALAFARCFAQTLHPGCVRPQHLVLETAAPEHVGLGTGTQLGMAVARGLALAHGLVQLDAAALSRRVGRGVRSGIGVNGFLHGGFLVDGGKGRQEGLAPLVARMRFPAEWRVVLALPRGRAGIHGACEQEAFARLGDSPATLERTRELCRLVLLGMLPALAERDLEAFGEALYDFNVRVGEAFAPVQGGTYAGPEVAAVVAFVRGQGVRGVAQSSWGPAVVGITLDIERGQQLAEQIRQRFGLQPDHVWVTSACNEGASVEHE